MPLLAVLLAGSRDADAHEGRESVADSASSDPAEAERLEAELKRLKRQQQTSKARAASLLSKQRKFTARAAAANLPPDEDERAEHQRTYFRSSRTWVPLQDPRSTAEPMTAERRRRSVWLYLTHMAQAVKAMFLGRGQAHQFPHCISININDDTDIRLGSGEGGSAEVRSIMNNLQHHILASPEVSAEGHQKQPHWFCIHHPLVTLHRPSADHVLAEFMSWVLSFCGHTGHRLEAYSIPSDIFAHVRRHVLAFVADSNPVNDKIYAMLIKAVHHTKLPTTALQIRCAIHHTCLTRKTLALGFEGYWSTLVRLGHLFEKPQLQAKVVCRNGSGHPREF